jgi:hypothetical protein
MFAESLRHMDPMKGHALESMRLGSVLATKRPQSSLLPGHRNNTVGHSWQHFQFVPLSGLPKKGGPYLLGHYFLVFICPQLVAARTRTSFPIAVEICDENPPAIVNATMHITANVAAKSIWKRLVRFRLRQKRFRSKRSPSSGEDELRKIA